MLLNGSGQGLRPCLSLGLCLEFGDYNCTEINAAIQQQAAILLVDDNAINLSKMVGSGVFPILMNYLNVRWETDFKGYKLKKIRNSAWGEIRSFFLPNSIIAYFFLQRIHYGCQDGQII